MQFQVPQFIITEDKIIGPLTIRQFIYVSIAGGFCFVLYFTVKPWLFILLSVVFLGAALALGMMRVSGRPLAHVLRAAFSFYWKPQLYLWQPNHAELSHHKTPIENLAVGGVDPGNAIIGSSLRNAWQKLQTGGKMSNQQFFNKTEERYHIFQKLGGDREAARRIDYK